MDEAPSNMIGVQRTSRTAIESHTIDHERLEATVQKTTGTPSIQNAPFVAEKDILSNKQDTVLQPPKQSVDETPPYHADTTAGQKRTASGRVKTPTSSTSPSEGPINEGNHSARVSPEVSPHRSPQIGQVWQPESFRVLSEYIWLTFC